MSELIKEVTPLRNLDVSNLYQAASPVRVVGSSAKAKAGEEDKVFDEGFCASTGRS